MITPLLRRRGRSLLWTVTTAFQQPSRIEKALSERTRSSSLSSYSNNNNNTATPSRRRQFRQIPVNPKVLQYIREQQVCRPERQARARRLDRLAAAAASSQQGQGYKKPPPLPFGPHSRTKKRQHIRAPKIVHDNADNGVATLVQQIDKLNAQRIPTVALCGRSNVGRYGTLALDNP